MAGKLPDKNDVKMWRPTREEVAGAGDKLVKDILAPGLKLVFVGINPGLYSAAIGHHFGRPGNRFWPALFGAGFTPRLFSPFESRSILELGYGLTNMVERATNAADELTREELRDGSRRLVRKIEKYKPKFVALLGVGPYRMAFEKPKAQVGLQNETLGGARVWVLPSPSGLNAHFTPKKLVVVFRELREALEKELG